MPPVLLHLGSMRLPDLLHDLASRAPCFILSMSCVAAANFGGQACARLTRAPPLRRTARQAHASVWPGKVSRLMALGALLPTDTTEKPVQDELVRSGIGSWRASRASAELLTLFLACCDPEILFGQLAAGLRQEMYPLSTHVLPPATTPAAFCSFLHHLHG